MVSAILLLAAIAGPVQAGDTPEETCMEVLNETFINEPTAEIVATIQEACGEIDATNLELVNQIADRLHQIQQELAAADVDVGLLDAPTCSVQGGSLQKVCATVTGSANPTPNHPACVTPTEPDKQTCWSFTGTATANSAANIVGLDWGGPHMGAKITGCLFHCGDAATSQAVHDNLPLPCWTWEALASAELLDTADDDVTIKICAS